MTKEAAEKGLCVRLTWKHSKLCYTKYLFASVRALNAAALKSMQRKYSTLRLLVMAEQVDNGYRTDEHTQHATLLLPVLLVCHLCASHVTICISLTRLIC